MKLKKAISILICLLILPAAMAVPSSASILPRIDTAWRFGAAFNVNAGTSPQGGEPSDYFLLGDVNFDGSVGVLDVLLIQNDKAMVLTLTQEQRRSGDIDGDGVLAVLDVLHIQKFLAEMYVEYPVGQWVPAGGDFPTVPTQDITDLPTVPATDPSAEPTDAPTSSPTVPATDAPEPTAAEPTLPSDIPTVPTIPEPTKPTIPEPTEPPSVGRKEMSYLYLRDETGTLLNGGRLWVYIPKLSHAVEMNVMRDGVTFRAEISRDWDELAFYRTADSVITPGNPEELPADKLWNAWTGLPARGQNDCFAVAGDGKGGWTAYDPTGERTIYFDAASCGWQDAYIYGWSFGLDRTFVPMEYVANGIYKLILPQAPAAGAKGLVFLNQGFWDGAFLTEDCVMEAGKNLYTDVRKAGDLWTGSWAVYPDKLN